MWRFILFSRVTHYAHVAWNKTKKNEVLNDDKYNHDMYWHLHAPMQISLSPNHDIWKDSFLHAFELQPH